jgi:1,4-alpha-glucan branching enzyme
VLFWTAMLPNSAMDAVQPSKIHRFIIYRPDISSVQLTGSFTGWQPTAMHRIGDSGYWEVEMALPDGEHRFAYLLEGSQRIADPTIPARERDDFGGENSILRVAS